MPDHAADAGVDHLLRDDRPGARVRLIVADDELEFHRSCADARRARIEFISRHARAVEIVLAVVRLWPGERRGKTDFDRFQRLRLRPVRGKAQHRQQHGPGESARDRHVTHCQSFLFLRFLALE
jgi:hypothetical protein